jgi:hypothetical protein
MPSPRLRLLTAPLFVVWLASISACGRGLEDSVNIFYRQIGICKTYDTPDGPVTTRPDEAFVVFEIEAIDNLTGDTFNFEPSFVYVDQSSQEQKTGWVNAWDRHSASVDPRFSKSLGVPGAAPAVIPKERKIELNYFLTVPVSTKGPHGSGNADPTSYELRYEAVETERGRTASSDGFLYIKTNALGTRWSLKDNCKAIELK